MSTQAGGATRSVLSKAVEALVPHPSPDSSPSSSPVPTGNVPSTLEHVELPLAQCKDPRSNAGKPPSRYGFEHDIATSFSVWL